jgi:hypothetical protein
MSGERPRERPQLAICAVCGEEFDQRRYQVMTPALSAEPFDKVECAEAALVESEWLRRRARRRRELHRADVPRSG